MSYQCQQCGEVLPSVRTPHYSEDYVETLRATLSEANELLGPPSDDARYGPRCRAKLMELRAVLKGTDS